MSRTSRLDQNPDIRRQFAEAYTAGETRPELAARFGVHEDTITRWTKDEQIQKLVSELREARLNRMVRKVDARLEALLDSDTKGVKDPRVLLEIRKTLAPARTQQDINLNASVAQEDAASALWQKLNENPELAAELLGHELMAAGTED